MCWLYIKNVSHYIFINFFLILCYLISLQLEDEIGKLTVRGLRNRQDTLNLSRLMVRCEDSDSRLSLLKILESGVEASKRLFLDYHGLKLLWSWMVDVTASHKCTRLKLEVRESEEALSPPTTTLGASLFPEGAVSYLHYKILFHYGRNRHA